MRVEGSATTISWIPSEAVAGPMKSSFKLGVSHYDSAPPDVLGAPIVATLDELNEANRFRFANHLRAWAEFSDDGELVEAAQDGFGHIGVTNLRLGSDIAVAAVAMPDLRPDVDVGPGLGPVHPDRRWPHRGADAARRAPSAVRAVPLAGGVDDARADAARRRPSGGPAAGGFVVPPPLALRRRRSAVGQERHDGLEGLGQHGVRQGHAVGRRGLPGLRDRSRDRPRARAVGAADARCGEAQGPQLQGGAGGHAPGRPRRSAVPAARRGARRRGRRQGRWPRSARAPCSASGPSSRTAGAPRR